MSDESASVYNSTRLAAIFERAKRNAQNEVKLRTLRYFEPVRQAGVSGAGLAIQVS